MRYLNEIAVNRALLASVLSWFIAQVMKVVFTAMITKKWNFGRMLGLGGMPSSHAATVCGLSTAVGRLCGFYSVEFAICCMFSLVVMTDAAGVRRAAGKQAALLNTIVQEMFNDGIVVTYERLKELLGHTPFEVLIGALLGILIGFIVA